MNIIVVWNSVHMQEAVNELQKKDMCTEELIMHISPIRWSHIQFYGDYMFSSEHMYDIDCIQLRELERRC
ncbi:Tn3 family transposase [Enterococcus faecium]|uniref:Tn3 family transposase n=1 Tax=Enterococcus TaxID=1350 RepID=UPI00338DD0DC